MSFIAIIGAGPLGGAIAHKLAARDRVREVRLIDEEGSIAEGKALDITQSAPIEGFSTRLSGGTSIMAAAGAAVIVIADQAGSGGEYSAERGLALLRQLARIDSAVPIVFGGATQLDLLRLAAFELRMDPARLIGSAPLALESALRALAGLAVNGSGVEVSLRVVGVPPRGAVVAWEEASAFGQPLSSQMAAHEIAALASRIPELWPPGPYALASAATRASEALASGSRRQFSCFVALGRDRAAAMPVELGPDGVSHIIEPALTRQERTLLDNALERNPRPV
jgi:malate dehydrogenase